MCSNLRMMVLTNGVLEVNLRSSLHRWHAFAAAALSHVS